MKRVAIPLVFVMGILAVSIFIVKNYLKFSGVGGDRPNQVSKTAHPRLDAILLSDQLTPTSVVYEWIPYYYRHPKPQETVEAIGVFLSQESADPAIRRAQIHFFATILHKHKEELEKLKASSFRYSGKQSETIIAIIRETENYQPIKEISPESLESMWAEYMVTGDKGIVLRMIQGLSPLESDDDLRRVTAIKDGFYRHLPQYSDAHKAFKEACKNTPGALGNMIEEIKKAIDQTLAESANQHLVRADNYIKQREYAQALDEFEKSLKYYPDYTNVYINLANMYEEQGKRREAFAAMKKAVQIEPSGSWACYGMGRQYFQQGKYDDAIKWYSKALESMPQNPLVVHAIARSYQSKGDTANAVKYFQQYLQLAPTGEHVDLVKRYLASVRVQAPIGESTSVFDAFKKKDFDTLEKKFAALLKAKQKDTDGNSLLAEAYKQICENPDAKYSMGIWLADFELWLKSKPSSHFAQGAIGIFYISYAWHARGSGWANTVTAEGHRLFEERLLKARDYLEKAYLSDQTDPIVPSKLITVAMGLGSDADEMEKQFRRSILADRTEFTAYNAKLTYLMPKWYGSQDAMFRFARETVRNAPPDSLAPLVLAKAHWEMYYGSNNREWYFRQPAVWSEVKSVYSTLCQRFPKSKERHNWFILTAYLAGDFQTAKQELAIIQDNWSPQVWGSYQKFAQTKEYILRR